MNLHTLSDKDSDALSEARARSCWALTATEALRERARTMTWMKVSRPLLE